MKDWISASRRSTEGTSIGGRGKRRAKTLGGSMTGDNKDCSQWGSSTLRASACILWLGQEETKRASKDGQLVTAKLQRSRCWFSLSQREGFWSAPLWPLGKSAKETKVAAGWQGYCSHLGERSWWLRLEWQRWRWAEVANTGCVLKVELKGFVNQLDVLCDREEKKKKTLQVLW